MGSGRGKTKIEVPKPFVYQTTVPEADFDYGKEILEKTEGRIGDLRQFERDTIGNRTYRGMVNKGNRVSELGSYLSSIPANQGSYSTSGSSSSQTGTQTGSQTTTTTVPYQQKSVQESGYDPGRYGEAGVGMEDLAELQRRGFNRNQISEYVDTVRGQGLNIGDRVGASLDLMHKQGTLPGAIKDSGYDPASAGEAGFGFEDVKELAGRGYGQQQIANYVNYLQSQKETRPLQTQSVQESGYDPAAFGEAGVGMLDLQELQKRGFNREQISNYVDDARSRGLNIGDRVGASLDLMNKAGTKSGAIKDSGYDPAAYGMGGVGFEDVKELASRGYGKQQISDYVNYARGQGLNIGERVGMTLDFMDPAKTKETQKYNIGDRVGMALGFMNPERTRTSTTFSSGSGGSGSGGSTSSYTTTGFEADSNFRHDLRNMYDDAVRDYGAFRKRYEESDQGKNSIRFPFIR